MTAKAYVGTYAKYNEGSIAGAWIELEGFTDAEQFNAVCAELHKDEGDPEIMIQDFEGFPKRYYSESGLDDALFEYLALDDDDRQLMDAYLDAGFDGDLSDAQDRYAGQFDNDVDFVRELLEDSEDYLRDLPHYIIIDWEATARNIMFDYTSENGIYFRNY
jgi:antirestriction protein